MLVVAPPSEPLARLASRARWIHGPMADAALALAWVPFAILAHVAEPSSRWLGILVAAVFVLSFAHQPLTVGLVYGDRAQYGARRSLYRIAPFAFAAIILIGLSVSLTLVALVAGLWNVEHTLMQRFGVTRIYGRKAGDDQGSIEKKMLVSWLVLGLVYVAGFVDIPALVAKVGLGATNARGMDLLHSLRPYARWLLVPAALVVVALAVEWWRGERALGAAANPAKHLYLVSTACLIVAVFVDPIAGFVGYVASHAVEYFVIVHRSVRSRADLGDTSMVATAASTRARRAVLYPAYFGAIALLIAVTYRLWGGRAYSFAILFFGGMHILYDGFIWKLRRPTVSRSLGIGP